MIIVITCFAKLWRAAFLTLLVLPFYAKAFASEEAEQGSVACSIDSSIEEASSTYQIPVTKIRAFLNTSRSMGYGEGIELNGRVGLMAIPLEWLPVFEYMGVPSREIVNNGCQSIVAGAWILAYQAEARRTQTTTQIIQPTKISALTLERRRRWWGAVQRASVLSGLPTALLDAVIIAESAYNQESISGKKAIGLMQLLASTAKEMGVNPYVGEENVLGGAMYLRKLYTQFSGNLELALAAYNAGPGSVSRNGYRIPAFTETQGYVPRVLSLYRALSN